MGPSNSTMNEQDLDEIEEYDPSLFGEDAPKNTLGLVAFIFSVLALLTMGLLSPVGLPLSIMALKKQPRALAIAGVFLSALAIIPLVFITLPELLDWLGKPRSGH